MLSANAPGRQRALPRVDPEGLRNAGDPAELRAELISALRPGPRDPEWISEAPSVEATLRMPLSEGAYEALIRSGLACDLGGRLAWRFQPIHGYGLLLFRDLLSRRFEREYVWLHDELESKSWRFIDAVRVSPGERLLDLGCGTGLNALRAAQGGATSIGIEINPRAAAIARLNATLNGLDDRVSILIGDWKQLDDRGSDLIVSQPPFDPAPPDRGRILAFEGGALHGLESAAEIIEGFQPSRYGQRMTVYLHSFAGKGRALIEDIIDERVSSGNRYSVETIKRYPIAGWWAGYRDRHALDTRSELPRRWAAFDEVRACHVRLWRAK